MSAMQARKTPILTVSIILLLISLLSGCAQPQTIEQIPVVKTPEAATPAAASTLPYPARPIYPPGTLVDYSAQDGDSLIAVAAHFNTTIDEILEANPLVPKNITTLQSGLQLKIPIYYKALWGSQYHILPDSLFVDGPAAIGFNTLAYVNSQPGWLKNYSAYTGEKTLRGGEVINYVADNFSISPRLLLAIAEYQTGALSKPVMDENQRVYPLGYKDEFHKGFMLQLIWAANALNNGYYGWRNGTLESFTHTDGTLEVPDPWQNAASVGLQYYFSQQLSLSEYYQAIGEDGLANTYQTLFGDPWENVQPHIPGNLQQVDLVLPFVAGKKWSFTGGPHAAWWGSGEPLGALDFAPPANVSGCIPSKELVVAMGDGIIAHTENAVVLLDLDGDGNKRTGWVIYYLHLSPDLLVSEGMRVSTGTPLGYPSCNGGNATGTHIHIARKYNGEWINADGMVSFNLEGWIAKKGSVAYKGTLSRHGYVVTASVLSLASSLITAGGQ